MAAVRSDLVGAFQAPRIYLDANASEPLRPDARAAMLEVLDMTGNPASLHAQGRDARRILEDARETLAAQFGAAPSRLVFCSGGTEADATAVAGLSAGRQVLMSAVEHEAIRSAAPSARVIGVDGQGVIRMDELEAALRAGPALLCLMLANNETGTLQPVEQAAEMCRQYGALLHVDAVQACGRMEVKLGRLGADSLAISSHKLGGPGGVGALLLSEAGERALQPLIRGGGQERGRRGGTPPLAVIKGFAVAATSPRVDLSALRDRAERAAVAHGAIVAGGGAPRLNNTVCLALAGVPALTQLMALDLARIAVSAGAACSSGKVTRSHVLDAMGMGSLAGAAIRVSLPWRAEDSDIDAFVDAYAALAFRLRRAA